MTTATNIRNLENYYNTLRFVCLEASTWYVKNEGFKKSHEWFKEYRRYTVINHALDFHIILSFMDNVKAFQSESLSYKIITNELSW